MHRSTIRTAFGYGTHGHVNKPYLHCVRGTTFAHSQLPAPKRGPFVRVAAETFQYDHHLSALSAHGSGVNLRTSKRTPAGPGGWPVRPGRLFGRKAAHAHAHHRTTRDLFAFCNGHISACRHTNTAHMCERVFVHVRWTVLNESALPHFPCPLTPTPRFRCSAHRPSAKGGQ